MPPANDNWASATALSAVDFATSSVGGNNIGATSETGEPANNGKTVWYSWTPTDDSTIVFSTARTSPYPTTCTPPSDPALATVLRVFTGSAVNALTEVTYLRGSFKQRYGGWDLGSQVIFQASTGTTYYIRVDGALSKGLTAVGTIVKGGTGYVVGDVLAPAGGDGQCAKLTVSSVVSGAVTGLTVSFAGSYSVEPESASNKLVTVTGAGNGAALDLTFGTVTCQGNFSLFWGVYWPPGLNEGCSNCPPMVSCGMTCVGTLSPDVTSSTGAYWVPGPFWPHGCVVTNSPGVTPLKGTVYSFGSSLPAGAYFIKYCVGAYATSPGATDYTVSFNAACGDRAEGFIVEWNDARHSGSRNQGFIAPSNLSGLLSNTQLGAEQKAYAALLSDSGCGFSFDHAGGDISIYLIDPIFTDNTSGSPSPVFGLYLYNALPNITQAGSYACAEWTTVGTSATCTFYVNNDSSLVGANITATLNNTGGISSASSPATGISMDANTTTAITFTFDCASTDVTATLLLSLPGSNCPDVELVFYLGPVISIVQLPVPEGGAERDELAGGCWKAPTNGLIYKNLGAWNFNAYITFATASPVGVYINYGAGIACSFFASSVTSEANSSPCDSDDLTLGGVLTFSTPDSSSYSSTMTITIKDDMGTVVYTDSYPIIVPAG